MRHNSVVQLLLLLYCERHNGMQQGTGTGTGTLPWHCDLLRAARPP